MRQAGARQNARIVLLLALVATVSWLMFGRPHGGIFLFALFPVLLLATIWFGAPGVRFVALLVAAGGIVGAARDQASLVPGFLAESRFNLQVFLASIAVVALTLPAFHERLNLFRKRSVIVLVAGWALAGLLFSWIQSVQTQADREDFTRLTTNAQEDIRLRLRIYIDALRGGAGFYVAYPEMTPGRWQTYVDSLQLNRRYPGIYGFGLILPVPRSATTDFQHRLRADGEPDFTVRPVQGQPDTDRPERFIITYSAPASHNHAALGLDIASETNRRAAAEIARDSGEPQLTGRITLGFEGQNWPGFLLLVPCYRPGAPLTTVRERRAALQAWAYAPFVTKDFLLGVLGKRGDKLRLHLFAGPRPDPAQLLYSSVPNGPIPRQFALLSTRELTGQIFTLGWNPGPDFIPSRHSPLVWLAVSFATVTAGLAGWMLSLQGLRERAEALAIQRTTALSESEVRYRALVEWSPNPLAIHRDGRLLYVNPAAIRLFGAKTATDLVGRSLLDLMHPDSRAGIMARMQSMTATGDVTQAAFTQILRLDGTAIDVEARSVTFPYEGAPAIFFDR